VLGGMKKTGRRMDTGVGATPRFGYKRVLL